jgi:hypothetical protein
MGWSQYFSKCADPDADLKSLQQRFRAIGHRHDRKIRLRKTLRALRAPALVAVTAIVVVAGIVRFSPYSLTDTLRHIAAAPNCAAARAVGLAPAHRGEPGYWPSHDADKDGISCE